MPGMKLFGRNWFQKQAPADPAGGGDAGGAPVRHVDPAGARAVLEGEEGVKVLDVRTPEEFAAGHLEGAVMVDFKGAGFREGVDQLDRDTTWLVHCKAGGRSMAALPTLQELGFERIVHLDGGYDAWAGSGLPTVR